MSSINIHRSHQLPLDELKQKIDIILLNISNRLDFRSEWETDRLLTFRRKGANGSIAIDESNFELTLKLGMMFRMMKGAIQKEMIEVVDEHINR
jgi:putative polyhydroxyalkanoate system protein